MLCISSYTIWLAFTFHRPSISNKHEWLLLLFWWPLEIEGPVCYYHVPYAFQSKYTLCSSLSVKERLPRNRRDIGSLSECRTDKYSERKSIIWPVRQNGRVFVCELSDCGFDYRCCHILCLNGFAKLQNARRASRQPVLKGNCPTCFYVLALSVYWMVCYQSVPGGVQGMRFRGHERGASWEESWHERYAGKCTQKYSKHDNEKWWHTNTLDW